MIDFVGLFLLLAGFIVGLGAVTVIDIHGFLARRSEYWTEATTRTHKVTKPLIWTGTLLAIVGGLVFFKGDISFWYVKYLVFIACILILNGGFLSFVVSPYLLKREKEGNSKVILESIWQRKITLSFLVSFFSWWSAVAVLVYALSYA